MRRLVLIAPGLAAPPGGESVLRVPPVALVRLAELGQVVRLVPTAPAGTPEAAWLGADPESLRVAQGPLTVAALRHDPPERSVQFHLSLLSVDDEGRIQDPGPVGADEARAVMSEAERLRTRVLTPLAGEGVDHALVWEDGSLDLATVRPEDAHGNRWEARQPEGDGEPMLRRLIGDSLNLLDGLEVNKRRRNEGRPPLNMLWPWGQGRREPCPNLALGRGEPAWVESRSLRLDGLARLVGDRHGDRGAFGLPLAVDEARLLGIAQSRPLVVALLHPFAPMRAHERYDQMARALDALASQVIDPLLRDPDTRLTLVAPGDAGGLAVTAGGGVRGDSSAPFDERVTDDQTVPLLPAWEAVARAMTGSATPD